LDPAAVLDRGYAVIEGARGIVTSVGDAHAGDEVRLRLSDGSMQARVSAVVPKGDNDEEKSQL
ncbi:MAG: exodeoxyribonuclease VII large subunit, partial [Clostridia bacterium]|nr:exodeoxyribonuclease VII large subunit [Clostridia bacterium]